MQPPFEPFRELLLELAGFSEFPGPEALTAWVDQARHEGAFDVAPLCFVHLAPKPRRSKRGAVEIDTLYDTRITCAREVPCLDKSYHDLFNALMFRAFPRSKRALHARQYEALLGWVSQSREQLPGRRTREQDALTLFDEGGSVVVCPVEWKREFALGMTLPLCRRESPAQLVVFGHALFEHLSEGQLGLRSTARVLFTDDRSTSLLRFVDDFVVRLLLDRCRFCVPDADAIVSFDGDGTVSFRRFDPDTRAARIREQTARSVEQAGKLRIC